jgi:hypothetical protein
MRSGGLRRLSFDETLYIVDQTASDGTEPGASMRSVHGRSAYIVAKHSMKRYILSTKRHPMAHAALDKAEERTLIGGIYRNVFFADTQRLTAMS